MQDVRYGFRADGSIRSIENTPQIDDSGSAQITVRTEYRYDGLARLSRARGEYTREYNGEQRSENWANAWAWAPNGNLLRRDTLDYASNSLTSRESYSYAGHALTAVDNSSAGRTQTLRYDDAGNLCQQTDNVSGESKTMEHDYANRISAVRNAAGDVVGRYWYDDQGFRVRRISRRKQESGDEKEVELLYPSMYFGIERSLDADGKPDKASGYAVNNIYVNGVRMAAMLPDAQAVYYLTDQVDSVKVITDDRGLPVTAMEYKPFGETWLTSGKTNHAPKYNSQELDRETGFYFYNARHYDPSLAHFVTADTVIDGEYTTQGWNRYMYCKGNPVLYKDPSGHWMDKLAVKAFLVFPVAEVAGIGYLGYKAYQHFRGDDNGGHDGNKPVSTDVAAEQTKSNGSQSNSHLAISLEQVKKNQNELGQGVDGNLAQLYKKDDFLKNLASEKNINPSFVNEGNSANSACYAIHAYDYLRGRGANVERSFLQFYSRWVKNGAIDNVLTGHVGGLDTIYNAYSVHGKQLQYTTASSTQELDNVKVDWVQVSINRYEGGNHSMNAYKEGGVWKASDSGWSIDCFGQTLNDAIARWGTLNSFMYGKER